MAKRKSKSLSQPVLDKKWQAESDARTLAEAKVIATDKRRMSAAAKAAAEMAEEKAVEAKAMKQIAKKGKGG